MTFDPQIHRRRSIRLQGYDYARPGAYFVTICVQNRESLLGEIRNERMVLNPAGHMVDVLWSRLPEKFPHVSLDESIIMPNHFHGIIWINSTTGVIEPVGADPCVRPGFDFTDLCVRPGPTSQPGKFIGIGPDGQLGPENLGGHTGPETAGGHTGPETAGGHMGPETAGGHTGPGTAGGHMGPPLQAIMQWFKTMTTNAYIRAVRENAFPPFAGRLWQRNYYERVIRDDRELALARQYITDNPAKWPTDHENPYPRP